MSTDDERISQFMQHALARAVDSDKIQPMSTPFSEPFSSADLVLPVSALNRMARELLEQRFPLMWVSGEVSNLTRAASGHFYFSLKDEAAQVRCVMFRSRSQLLPFQLQNGMQVEARVLVTLYEARGDFQLNVEGLRRAGVGLLFEAFAKLRDKLAREGLFDDARKRPLPTHPRSIGVVTSPAAAALRDVLVTLRRRARHVPVIIYPTPVQGDGVGAHIAQVVREAGRRAECDVLILTRGGGSIEDLWAFNDEALARAIASSPIPVVCGVGHETDVTMADLAADVRAPTPTAAAELASAGHVESVRQLHHQRDALSRVMQRTLHMAMQRLDWLAGRLHHPRHRMELSRVRLANLRSRLALCVGREARLRQTPVADLRFRLNRARPQTEALHTHLERLTTRLREALARQLSARQLAVATIATHLAHLDPQAILRRGYSIVRDAQGHIVDRASLLAAGDRITVQFAEGQTEATVTPPAP